jgi:hypothetical protein
VFGNATIVTGLVLACVGAPAAGLFFNQRSRRGGAHRRRSKPDVVRQPSTWRLSHKVGNDFVLTNIAGAAASEVEVSGQGTDVDVRPRHAPWRVVERGNAVEFVVVSKRRDAGAIAVQWKTADGKSKRAEVGLLR